MLKREAIENYVNIVFASYEDLTTQCSVDSDHHLAIYAEVYVIRNNQRSRLLIDP